jgi:hypothetical protein
MFNDIRSIIPKAIERAGLSKKVSEVDLFEVFSQTIDNYLSEEDRKKVRPVFFRDKILFIASLSDRATKRINQNKEKIIAIIKEKNVNDMIREIKILT